LVAQQGGTVTAVLVGSRVHEEGLDAARHAGVHIISASDVRADEVVGLAEDAGVIVDGILGIGARGPLREPGRSLVAGIQPLLGRNRRPFVVAVDIPSGIDPDTGQLADATVLRADVTVTFGAYKAGLLAPEAA